MNPFSERVRDVCARHAGRVAVLDRGRAFTFAELEQRVGSVQRQLREGGVGPGALVALGGARTFSRIAELVALLRVGAVPLLLCPRWPGAYRDACVARSGASHQLEAGVLAPAMGDAPAEPLPRDAAYLIYTSGSSGSPKGVLVSHAGLVSVLDAQIAAFALRPGSRSLFLLGLAFDASLSDIGTALLAGATLVLEDDAACAPSRLLATIAKRGVTYADIPPAYLGHLDADVLPACLTTLVVGGEVAPERDVRRLAGRVALFNVYGPTEATICTSLGRCDTAWSRPLLGQPIAGNTYEIAPHAGLASDQGELLITGPGLALGYHRDEALTAERFVVRAGRRWFRTGDVVRRHARGEWEFRGRVDRQLKRRGQLVAPEEVEAALLRAPAVRAASVFALEGGQRLIAHVETHAPMSVAERVALGPQLREALRDQLPAGRVPDDVVVVDVLPRGATGKLMHARPVTLVEVAPSASPPSTQAQTPPRSESLSINHRPSIPERGAPSAGVHPTTKCRSILEEGGWPADGAPRPGGDRGDLSPGSEPDDAAVTLLGALMGQRLGRARLLPDEDFFDAGGTSLNALEVAARAEAAGFGVSPVSIADGRTPRGTLRLTHEDAHTWTTRAALEPHLGSVAPLRAVPAGTLSGAQVFLTGASGTLGRALLPRLLQELGPAGRVHCLLRRADALDDALSTSEPEASAAAREPRVVVHVGGVAEARFGLEAERYHWLADEVDVVIHLAARLSAAAALEALLDVNLEGTRRVLQLCADGRPKALLHASTLAVFTDALPRRERCLEDDHLASAEALLTPYAASKWLAERLVRSADPQARAATIVRLGLLTGGSSDGRGAPQGHLSRFIRGLARMGALPEPCLPAAAELTFDVTPLDHAADTCVALLRHDRTSGAGGTYHVAAAQPASFEALLQAMHAEGIALAPLPTSEFFARAGAQPDASGDVALSALSLARGVPGLLAHHRALDLFAATGAHFSLVNTTRAIASSSLPGSACAPRPDHALLCRYVRAALA